MMHLRSSMRAEEVKTMHAIHYVDTMTLNPVYQLGIFFPHVSTIETAA